MFLENILERARDSGKRIVFPECDDSRLREAVKIIADTGIAVPVLINCNLGLPGIEYREIDERYNNSFYELRKHKINREEADKLMKDPFYFGTMMVKMGDADGLIGGITAPTARVLKPALQIMRKTPNVSGAMILVSPDQEKVLVFADAAIIPKPTPEQLSEIGLKSAETASKIIGPNPKVAFLSFSTKGSAKHEIIDKVKRAAELSRNTCRVVYSNNEAINCDYIDSEYQIDAALSSEVAKMKAPEGIISGDANVLIFPDLNSGNISYKLLETLGGYRAIGPVLQGMEKPINDLSRGCRTEDIVYLAAVTVIQAMLNDTEKTQEGA